MMSENRLPLELYLHIPFCVQKCRYCDFLSAPADICVQEAYMQALITEVRERSEEGAAYTVTSVFIGGGTPTVVPAAWISRLLETVFQYYRMASDAEISMEMNPGTVDAEALAVYRKAGVNRLSIGLQSASDEELKALGRIHTYSQFLDTYYGAREAGFTNLNVDLMSALPGQSLAGWESTLHKALSLTPSPEHISAYSLIVEEGTPFYRMQEEGSLFLPDEDTERMMYDLTEQLLNRSGYHRYEISNYAKAGRECRHNIGYWRRTPYLGFGIGAASLLEETRFSNDQDLKAYISDPLGQRTIPQSLTLQEQMEEFMFLGLRIMEGISSAAFHEKFGKDILEVYGEVLSSLMSKGLLEAKKAELTDGNHKLQQLLNGADIRYHLTARGVDVSNMVLSEFLLS